MSQPNICLSFLIYKAGVSSLMKQLWRWGLWCGSCLELNLAHKCHLAQTITNTAHAQSILHIWSQRHLWSFTTKQFYFLAKQQVPKKWVLALQYSQVAPHTICSPTQWVTMTSLWPTRCQEKDTVMTNRDTVSLSLQNLCYDVQITFKIISLTGSFVLFQVEWVPFRDFHCLL